MKRYLIRLVRHNKKGRRIGKFKVIYAKNMKEALLKHLNKTKFRRLK